MIVQDVPHLTNYLLEKHGLLQQGWRFEWDNAKRRAGCCKHRTKRITLSRHYVALNVEKNHEDVVDTILHEIAHALTPGDHHGDKWKAACNQVGAKPQRCYDVNVVVMPKGRFVATCGGCGEEFRVHRYKRLSNGGWWYCARCGPERGRLEYRDTAVWETIAPIHKDDAPPAPSRLRGT